MLLTGSVGCPAPLPEAGVGLQTFTHAATELDMGREELPTTRHVNKTVPCAGKDNKHPLLHDFGYMSSHIAKLERNGSGEWLQRGRIKNFAAPRQLSSNNFQENGLLPQRLCSDTTWLVPGVYCVFS